MAYELKFQRGIENEILRAKSQPLTKIDGKHRKFIKAMEKEMFAENGVGLAASQVGHNIRIITTRLNTGTSQEIIVPMVNPEILEFGKELAEEEEGCLSVPETWGIVERPSEIVVTFLTPKSKQQTLRLADLNARIVQHEVDHLDGILFVDKAKETYKKAQDEDEADIHTI